MSMKKDHEGNKWSDEEVLPPSAKLNPREHSLHK